MPDPRPPRVALDDRLTRREHLILCAGILVWGAITYFFGWWAGSPLMVAAMIGVVVAIRKIRT